MREGEPGMDESRGTEGQRGGSEGEKGGEGKRTETGEKEEDRVDKRRVLGSGKNT